MSDLIDRPLTMPPYPSHGTPPGSTVDLGDGDVWLEVIADMEARRTTGVARYGKAVMAGDQSEDWLRHAYEEMLDGAVYLKAAMGRRGVPAVADDEREHDLDRLVATTSQLLVGRTNLNDRDIKDAVAQADRVIHFCRLHTYGPYTPPPVVLSDIEGD